MKFRTFFIVAIVCILFSSCTSISTVKKSYDLEECPVQESLHCPNCGADLHTDSFEHFNENTMKKMMHDVGNCVTHRHYNHRCIFCNKTLAENVEHEEFGDHIYEETIIKAPTCTEEGENLLVCKYCGHEETRRTYRAPHREVMMIHSTGFSVECLECHEYKTHNFKDLVGYYEMYLPRTSTRSLSTTGRNYYYYCGLDVQVVCDHGVVVAVNY